MTGFRSCCGFPHGPRSMYAMILGISSYLLSISASWGCYFTSVDFVLVDKSPTQFIIPTAGRMGMGLFSFEDKAATSDLTCKMYSDAQIASFDSSFVAARYMGVLASIFIGSGMIFLLCLSCIVVRKPVIKSVSALLLLGGLFMGTTFVVYASDAVCGDGSCNLFFGSGLTLTCTLITFMNAIITYRIPEADDNYLMDDRSFRGRHGHFDEEQQAHPDVGKNQTVTAEDEFDLQPTSSSDEEGEDEIDIPFDETSVWTAPGSPTKAMGVADKKARRQIITTIVNKNGSKMVEENTVEN